MYKAIVCVDKKNGIGRQGTLPWHNKEDIKFFKQTTTTVKNKNKVNAVIMGRITWESIPQKHRPLPNRMNIIISSTMYSDPNGDYHVFPTVDDALFFIESNNKVIETAFVIGGATIYEQFLQRNLISSVYMTMINYDYQCDIKFPTHYLNDFKCVEKITLTPPVDNYEIHGMHVTSYNYGIYVNVYEYVNYEEQQYLSILQEIKEHGVLMQNRTGIDTKSLFVRSMRFNLRDGRIPVLTTKRTFFRGGAEEMLFFLSGSTDVQKLRDKNIFYWDANTTKEFLESRGLPFNEYDMGATYGFLYRHFGAEYRGKEYNYTDQGFDQVQFVIDEIKRNPGSRRLIIDLWSPEDVNNCALPPCFTENNLVITNNGYKRIKDVNDTDLILTHNGNFEKIMKKMITPYSGDLYKLTLRFQSIPIETTPNHPFYVRKVKYAYNTGINNKMVISQCTEPEWLEAEHLTEDHYCGIQINTKNIIPDFTITKGVNGSQTKTYKKVLDNIEEWYLLGYFLGDGWCRWDRNYGSFNLVFNKRDEEELVSKFSKLCTMGVKQKQKGCTVYRCYSYDLLKILKQFGKHAHNKIIPEWVQNAPKEYIQAFINGYEKADGCLHKNLQTMGTVSYNIAYGLQRLYLKLGIFVRLSYHEPKNKIHVIEGRVVNQRPSYGIHYLTERKHRIRPFIEDNYAWFPIRKIEKTKIVDTKVYNFEIDNDNTYTVNNVSVHNCLFNFIFYVDQSSNEISLHATLRSSDFFLGCPLNLVNAAVLLRLICHCTGYNPGDLILTGNNVHFYMNQVEAVDKQLSRSPNKVFPKLYILTEERDIFKIKYEDLQLINYSCDPAIHADMAV